MQLAFVLFACLPLWCTEPTSDSSDEEIGVILVVTQEALDCLVNDEIDRTIPIDRTVQGIRVTGSARGVGRARIELNPSPDSARFSMVIRGNVGANFGGTVGPVWLGASTRATIESEKTLRFNGEDFQVGPAETKNCNFTTVDQICPRRRALSRVVRGIAACVVRKNKQELDRQVQTATRDLLNSQFDRKAEELGKLLDDSLPFPETIRKTFPDSADWKVSLSTRADSMVAGIGPQDSKLPAEFVEGREGKLLGDRGPALAELWIRTTPAEAAFIALVADWDVAYDLLRENIEDEELAKQLAEDVDLVSLDGWTVIRIGIKNSGLPKP